MASNNLRTISLPTICAAVLALGIIMGHSLRTSRRSAPTTTQAPTPAPNSASAQKLTTVLSLIDAIYVDPISTDSLVEGLLPELLLQLDPHSTYIPAEQMQEVNEPLEGEFDGIGVVFNMTTDTVVVLSTTPGGPSYKAGVLAGDRIITVDGDTVAGRRIPQNDIVSRLRGKRGTQVRVGIRRDGVEELVDVDITRDKIPLNSIDAAFIIRPGVGYIRLTSFSRDTHRDFLKAVAELREQGMQKLIFDLRSNSGGYLDQAISMTNEFLPEGKLMVYTEDRAGRQMKEYSTGGGQLTEIPLAVLIDDYSASSSEIVAGALQDNDRGTIIGRRSFGKGLVQNQIPLGDGSAVRLTVARYYTPTGRSIQKPYERGSNDYGYDIIERYEHGEMFSAENIHFADSLKFTTPGGKVVYGGGGIMPDIFVPIDTLDMTPYYYATTGLNVLYRYTLDYADRHRAAINAVESIDQLEVLLDGDKRLLEDFVDYAQQKGIKPNWKQIRTSEKLLRSMLRAYIARNTPLQEVGYFSQIVPIDDSIQKALEVLEGEEVTPRD